LLLINKHIKQFAFFYLFCFLLSSLWFLCNGLFFSSLQPVFFLNKLDITRNVILLSDLQNLLIRSSFLRWLLDIVYVLLPILLTVAVVKEYRAKKLLVITTSIFSLVYGILFSGVSYISIEGYFGWILLPLVFLGNGVQGFYYGLNCVRLIFILTFCSTAIWKLQNGGFFNIEEMAGILLQQHNAYLISSKGDWFTNFVYYLVKHKVLAYILYLTATILEGLFVIGLFTKKIDKYLIIVFCAFVFFDFILMRINYFGWGVFMGCFYFSNFSLKEAE
jgi:hypothetical protein